MDMQEHDPMYDERSTKLAHVPNAFPSWDRETLALKIQANDGCTRREAKSQIDRMARSFSQFARAPSPISPFDLRVSRTAQVYVRYHADCSRRPGCQRRMNRAPVLEHCRS
jgi:hypothetical protein